MEYYKRYDDLYEEFYRRGFQDWWYGPESENKARMRKRIAARVLEAIPNPDRARMIEIGCGEAPLALEFHRLGIDYTGVDCSPHVISRAIEQANKEGHSLDLRVVDALTPPPDLPWSGFDIVLDHRCLQMFVLDEDRSRYLSNVKRLLAPTGAFVVADTSISGLVLDRPILTLEDYEHAADQKLSEPREWEAWDGESWQSVMLPRFAIRGKSLDGYTREFVQAGFEVQKIYNDFAYGSLDGTVGGVADFILRARA